MAKKDITVKVIFDPLYAKIIQQAELDSVFRVILHDLLSEKKDCVIWHRGATHFCDEIIEAFYQSKEREKRWEKFPRI